MNKQHDRVSGTDKVPFFSLLEVEPPLRKARGGGGEGGGWMYHFPPQRNPIAKVNGETFHLYRYQYGEGVFFAASRVSNCISSSY